MALRSRLQRVLRASRVVPVTELALRNCDKFEGTSGSSGEILSYSKRLSPRHHFAFSANRIRA